MIIAVVYPERARAAGEHPDPCDHLPGTASDRATINTLDSAVAEAMREIGYQADGSLNADKTDTSS